MPAAKRQTGPRRRLQLLATVRDLPHGAGVAAAVETSARARSDPAPAAARWEQGDVRGLRAERTCDFGESYLARASWHRPELDGMLAEQMPAGRESVTRSQAGALLTARGSAPNIPSWASPSSGLTPARWAIYSGLTLVWSTTRGSTGRSTGSASTRTPSAPT